jgi:hypothetical protein
MSMNRVWFASGLRGMTAKRIQLDLMRQGFMQGPADKFADGDFGDNTVRALGKLQLARGLPNTGSVDAATWAQLTADPLPTLFERCMGVTAEFEGHGFGLVQGNFDGAGLTWGLIGFTLSNGEIQEIIKTAELQVPGTLERVFGPLAAIWRNVVAMPRAAQISWADGISIGASKTATPPEWKSAFARLGDEPAVKRIQLHRAYEAYFVPAVATARKLQLTSELGVALAFDCHVQNGASRTQAVAQLQPLAGTLPERDMRLRFANQVADNSAARWREDVRGRKTTLAQGYSPNFRGKSYTLAHWGLAEYAAA